MPEQATGGPTLAQRVHGSPALRRRQWIGRALAVTFGRVVITGLEHVPPTGPVVIAVNHRALLDGPILFGLIDRPVSFLVKAEAFHPAPMAALLRSSGQIPVRRRTIDPAPIRLLLDVLRAGGVVGVFPEGSRGDGRVRSADPGAAYLALRTGAAVVPVACHGTAELGHRRTLRRPAVRVTVGEPLGVSPWPERSALPRRVFRAESERVRATLAELVAATEPAPAGGGPHRPGRRPALNRKHRQHRSKPEGET